MHELAHESRSYFSTLHVHVVSSVLLHTLRHARTHTDTPTVVHACMHTYIRTYIHAHGSDFCIGISVGDSKP